MKCLTKVLVNNKPWRAVAIALAVSLAYSASFAAIGSAQEPLITQAEDCGYSGCHGGAPLPGSVTTAAPTPAPAPTPLVLSRPAISRRPRARKATTVSGTLSAAHYASISVRLEFARKVGRRYIGWRSVTAVINPGATAYTTRVKLPKRGNWRVRAVHADDVHSHSASSYRAFVVR